MRSSLDNHIFSKKMAHQLFIGRLPLGCRSRDVEDIFFRYGKMTRCDVKQGMKMAYGFIEYDDRRDAEDALRHEHGREFQGNRIVVEWSRGGKGDRERDNRSDRRDDGGGGYHGRPRERRRDYSPDYGRGRSPPNYRDNRRSPEYGRRSSPEYRGRRSPEYGGGRSPDYGRKGSPRTDDRHHRSRSHERY